jgi:hypothetical protein
MCDGNWFLIIPCKLFLSKTEEKAAKEAKRKADTNTLMKPPTVCETLFANTGSPSQE